MRSFEFLDLLVLLLYLVFAVGEDVQELQSRLTVDLVPRAAHGLRGCVYIRLPSPPLPEYIARALSTASVIAFLAFWSFTFAALRFK